MDSSQATFVEPLQCLSDNPPDEDLLRQVKERISKPEYHQAFLDAVETLSEKKLSRENGSLEDFETLGISRNRTWVNCIGEQKCHPKSIRRPTSCQDLVKAVHDGKANNLPVRAVGSGHSFSDVAPTDGILLDLHRMKKVLEVDASILVDPSCASTLFSVESGITIKDLNKALEKQKLALINMGAYAGQTLAGAISTGTHGTGLSLGPMASSVRSMVLVSETGTIYQIEPRNGITDATKFGKSNPGLVLKQDDDWFQSNVVAMGCMGLIYSYTLEVQTAYFLKENRSLCTWEALKSDLLDGSKYSLLTSNRHFEIDVNPYKVDGAHTCIKIIRNCDPGPRKGWRGAANWISGLIAQLPIAERLLVDYLNIAPQKCPGIINTALHTLVDTEYVNKSYKIMDLGPVDKVKALALEFSLDADANLVASIDNLLAGFQRAAEENSWYLAGPVTLRFVAPSSAYLAPQAGRPSCMAECDLLIGIKNGEVLLKTIKEQMCLKGSGVRVHWGLDLDTVTAEEVPGMFPQYNKWLDVYRQLNSTGMFNNRFTDRLKISTAKA